MELVRVVLTDPVAWVCWGLVGLAIVAMVALRGLVRSRYHGTPAATWQRVAQACKRAGPLFWVWSVLVMLFSNDLAWAIEFVVAVILPLGLVFTVMGVGFSSLSREQTG